MYRKLIIIGFIFVLLSSFVNALDLEDYYNINDDGTQAFYGNEWSGQTFTTNQAYNIKSIKIKVYRVGSPSTLTCDIYATSSDLPTGSALVSGTTDSNVFTTSTSGDWYEITFSTAYGLSDATKYALVCHTASSVPNYLMWKVDKTSPTYAGGSRVASGNGGTSWAANTAQDMMFETYSEEECGGCVYCGTGDWIIEESCHITEDTKIETGYGLYVTSRYTVIIDSGVTVN